MQKTGTGFLIAGAMLVSSFSTLLLAQESTVTGPVGSATSEPMLNPSAIALAEHGYVEEEFFIEGTASQYTTPEMATGEVIDQGHPFRTRFVVRRPQRAEQFNGVVIIEWNNVTASRDLDIDWWQSGEHLVRNGYAFIAVSAQRIGIEHLKNTRPDRYGSLDVTHNGMITNDALSYDIFSAIARAVPEQGEPAPEVDILGGLKAKTLIATGHSQSASRLAAYVNHVHPLDPVFDGFMVHGGGDRIRDDQPVRVFKIMAETDMARRAATPQPNSYYFRQWEVAGTSHVDIPFEIEYAKMVALEAGRPTDDVAPRNPVCDKPTYSHVPFRYAMNAAYEHLRAWVEEGALPPVAPPLEVARMGPPLEFARDVRGNILGGIQLAQHAVPVATNTGMNSGDAFCRLYGSHEPFDPMTLRQLYPDQKTYLDAVQRVVDANVAAGYILEHDAGETMAAARASGIGRW